eukprot:CAMPEP_0206332188 /NCGR_PEP_ID=MMETSP0106_2-20121207/24640_1 /ASSEMBLY_ACC=CAM_ASM_000206 /TAXON_ID=81532 /ORGANISM="Acanthoeca-like sp., Strain 10tr" /LENGTH=114 /DNA_ID=CAMNT_0053765039 /DNA_START=304 /DNA_END=648 /DNA_ORIENTATION=-
MRATDPSFRIKGDTFCDPSRPWVMFPSRLTCGVHGPSSVGEEYTVVVHAAESPPGQVNVVGGWLRGHPQVQSSHSDLSAVREMTGLWASAPTASPSRVNGPSGEVDTEWMTVDR